MVSLSVWDVLFSFFFAFLSSWPVPEGTVWGSMGNQTSCTAQGFLVHFFATFSTLTNATLAVTYLLIVRYSWTEERLRRSQPILLFLVPFCIAVIVTIPPLIYDAYNFGGLYLCFIQASPLGCDDEDSATPCERGANAKFLSSLSLVPIVIANIISIGSMILLYRTILHKERARDQYRPGGSLELDRRLSRRVAMQGIYFSGAYVLTWFCFYVFFVLAAIGVQPSYWMQIIAGFYLPLQGFLNAIVYLRTMLTKKNRKIMMLAISVFLLVAPLVLIWLAMSLSTHLNPEM
jgi:hypothetical protein